MSLSISQFYKPYSKRSGGIRSVHLVRTGDVREVEHNELMDSISSVTLASGVSFAKIEFEEDSASMKETILASGGSIAVRHELTFTLTQVNHAAYYSIVELLNANSTGFLAVVETNCGDKFLMGYSTEFGADRGLMISRMNISTGTKLTDQTGTVVVLASEDTMPSRKFGGTV